MNLFRRKKKSPVDLSLIHTDMHSHIIPGIDDGSQSMEESVEMIRLLYRLGYRKIITTPHVNSDFFPNTTEIITAGLASLKDEIKKEGIPIELNAAAEYAVDYDFQTKKIHQPLMTLPGNYLLIEFSYYSPPENIEDTLFKLQIAKYQIILAHPERYAYWANDFSTFEKLKDRGIYFQLNINSLNGFYSPLAKKMAEKLIKNQMIDLIGSDAHSSGHVQRLSQSLSNKHLINLVESGKLINDKL